MWENYCIWNVHHHLLKNAILEMILQNAILNTSRQNSRIPPFFYYIILDCNILQIVTKYCTPLTFKMAQLSNKTNGQIHKQTRLTLKFKVYYQLCMAFQLKAQIVQVNLPKEIGSFLFRAEFCLKQGNECVTTTLNLWDIDSSSWSWYIAWIGHCRQCYGLVLYVLEWQLDPYMHPPSQWTDSN